MATLHDVPVELVLHIIALLSQKARALRSLRSLSLVSRSFRSLAQPFLYHDPVIECNPHILSFLNGNKDSRIDKHRRLRQFVRTVTARPELGTYVRRLTLVAGGGKVSEYSLAEETRSILLHGSVEEVKEDASDPISQNSGIPSPDRHPKLFREASDDIQQIAEAIKARPLPSGLVHLSGVNGLIILLLHFLPGLEALEAHANNTIETVACASLGALPGGIPAGLSSLRTIRMLYDSGKEGFHSNAVLPFLVLPNLHQFTISTCRGGFGERAEYPLFLGPPASLNEAPSDAPIDLRGLIASARHQTSPVPTPLGYLVNPRTSPLAHLEMTNSVLSPYFFHHALSLPSKLESFSFELGGSSVSRRRFLKQDLLPALHRQRDNLTALTLYLTREAEYEGNYYNRRVSEAILAPFTAFSRLEHLSIALDFLLRRDDKYDLVPSSQRVEPASEEEDLWEPDHERAHHHRRQGRPPKPGCTDPRSVVQNPMDALLPPTLVCLELRVTMLISFSTLSRMTGMPYTLPRTKRVLPRFRVLEIETDYGRESEGLRKARVEWAQVAPRGLDVGLHHDRRAEPDSDEDM